MDRKKPRSIFDILFNDDFFTNRMNFSMEDDNFPKDDDSNFSKIEETVETETHSIKKEIWVSIDGTQKFERTSMSSKQAQKTLKEPSKEELKVLLARAVEDQEYEKAIEYRDKLSKLE